MLPLKTRLRQCINWAFELTPFQVTRRLPSASLDIVPLALAWFLQSRHGGSFVQVGACDGIVNDPVFDIIRLGKVRAILVEPIESSYQRLKNAYRDIANVTVLQSAIALEDGLVPMYKVKLEGRWKDSTWAPQIASFQRRHLVKHGVRLNEIEKVHVPGICLSSLVQRFSLPSIDFLQCDTEGFDAEVVKMALKLSVPPKYIYFEHNHLSSRVIKECFDLLEKHAYCYIHGRHDSLAVHQTARRTWTEL